MSVADAIAAALPAGIRVKVNFRTWHGVEVGVADWKHDDGREGIMIFFPDGKFREVRSAAYANLEEAMAAEVAVWRLRRISRGIDKPAPAAGKPSMPQEAEDTHDHDKDVYDVAKEFGELPVTVQVPRLIH